VNAEREPSATLNGKNALVFGSVGTKRVRVQLLCRPALAVDLGRDLVDDRVHSASCSLDGAVRDILRCDHRVLRHVPGRADRSRLNAAYCNGETEHD
jgi:hypothetical protein